jgi:hypothetical protein
MKKRAMKKWIPKDTIYCYYDGKYHSRSGRCRFYTENRNVTEEEKNGEYTIFNDGYCKLLRTDITDMCKACDVSTKGWFDMNQYKGLSSHWCKKMREWKKKHPQAEN